jgi:metal-responsive CopG/Arc/MetJ family transcriptional regulator
MQKMPARKSKIGRPRKPDKLTRITFDLDLALLCRVDEIANAFGVSRNAAIRELLESALRCAEPTPEELEYSDAPLSH